MIHGLPRHRRSRPGRSGPRIDLRADMACDGETVSRIIDDTGRWGIRTVSLEWQDGTYPGAPPYDDFTPKDWLESLRECEVIVADDIHQAWLNELPGQRKFSVDWENHPAIRPPFDKTWIEFRADPRVTVFDTPEERAFALRQSFDHRKGGFPRGWGWLLWTYRPDEFTLSDTMAQMIDTDDIGAYVIAYAFAQEGDGRGLCGPLGVVMWVLDKEGKVFPVVTSDGVKTGARLPVASAKTVARPSGTEPAFDARATLQSLIMTHEITAYHTLSLLNCRNVSLEPRTPKPLSAKKRREWHGPHTGYHVLKVRAPGGRTITFDGNGQSRNLPLHVVRGHFKTYIEERPRFGKQVGTFWYPAHPRGKVEHGVADKDYEVIDTGTPVL